MTKEKKFASVWDAIESDTASAANMKLRAELMIALTTALAKQGGTQSGAAKRLGVTQPRLNDLMRGKIEKFSLDALVALAYAAGLKVSVKISKAA